MLEVRKDWCLEIFTNVVQCVGKATNVYERWVYMYIAARSSSDRTPYVTERMLMSSLAISSPDIDLDNICMRTKRCSSDHSHSRNCPVGLIPSTSQQFEEHSDHLEPTRNCPAEAFEPLEFEVGQSHRTSLNHCDAMGSRPTGQFRDSSGWFEGIEPHQNTVILGEAGLLGSFV